MKSLYKIVAVLGLSFIATSCFDKSKPNYQFFPNMYESVAYETYVESDAFNSENGLKGKEVNYLLRVLLKEVLCLMKFQILQKDIYFLKL